MDQRKTAINAIAHYGAGAANWAKKVIANGEPLPELLVGISQETPFGYHARLHTYPNHPNYFEISIHASNHKTIANPLDYIINNILQRLKIFEKHVAVTFNQRQDMHANTYFTNHYLNIYPTSDFDYNEIATLIRILPGETNGLS